MMPLRHVAAALLVVLVWGINFVVIRIGLRELPPLLMSGLRFLLAALPAVFFVRRPPVPFGRIVLYGLVMFCAQFSLLFSGMALGMPAGLASLALQMQVFLTIALAALVSGERPSLMQVSGALVAFGGIALIASRTGGEASLVGLVLVLLAALAWANGNLISKRIGAVDALALVVWGSLVAAPPLLLLSLLLEGPGPIAASIRGLTWTGVAALGYIVYPTTLMGFGIWSALLRRYPAASVAPFTLLVPVAGFSSAALMLGEPLQSWKIWAAALVVTGLLINLLGPRLAARHRNPGLG